MGKNHALLLRKALPQAVRDIVFKQSNHVFRAPDSRYMPEIKSAEVAKARAAILAPMSVHQQRLNVQAVLCGVAGLAAATSLIKVVGRVKARKRWFNDGVTLLMIADDIEESGKGKQGTADTTPSPPEHAATGTENRLFDAPRLRVLLHPQVFRVNHTNSNRRCSTWNVASA